MSREDNYVIFGTGGSGRGVSPEETKPKNDVKERLEKLGALFQQRNGDYGDTFRSFGMTMAGFFPDGLTVKTVEDWNRLALYMHVMDKMARYATNFSRGGHRDSLDDVAVYAQILQMIDAEASSASSTTVNRRDDP